jgi:hypothetical protein
MYRVVVELSPKATVQRVEMEGELEHGFFVHYDNGQNCRSLVGFCAGAAT